jgi:hypothetical protein
MMNATELVLAYRKVIDKHYAAVQTDAALMLGEDRKMEKKATMYWEEFRDLEAQFLAQLRGIRR